MGGFGFRYKFRLPLDECLGSKESTVAVPIVAIDKCELSAVDSATIQESRELVVSASGFADQAAAMAAGDRIQLCTQLVAIQLGFGVSSRPERGRMVGWAGGYLMERIAEQGARVVNDAYGVVTFENDVPSVLIGGKGVHATGYPIDSFLQAVAELYDETLDVGPKQILAIELYHASHFETSPRVRFITLITCVEVLSDNKRLKSATYLDCLRSLKKYVRKVGITEPEKESLLSRLGELKYASISESCQQLICQHLGIDESEQFKALYSVRSKLVHEGRAPKGVSIENSLRDLDRLVSNLLRAIILRPKTSC